MLTCPRCKGSLTTLVKDGVEIEECNECGGMWLDANELRTLTGGVEPPDSIQEPVAVENEQTNEQPPEENSMLCPKCDNRKLTAFIYDDDTGIELDYCPDCGGLWLDKNELQQIEFFANMKKETTLIAFNAQSAQSTRVEKEEYARSEFVRKMKRNATIRRRGIFSLLPYGRD